ncbi:MAG TPA: DUF559 domain-containing protein [Nakamurella sp.]
MPNRRQPIPPTLKAGAFTLAQGRAAGLRTGRMRGSDLDRPFRGVRVVRDASAVEHPLARFGLPVPPAELVERCAALAVGLGREPTFSHLTAALLWPVPLPRLDPEGPLHIGVRPPGHPPQRQGVRAHKLLDPHAYAVDRHGRRIIDPATMFCQLGAVLSPDDLVAVGDALIYVPPRPHQFDDRPWLSLRELTERVEVFRGRGKAAARRAVGLIRPGVESRPETLVRLALVAAALPEPEVNVTVFGPGGRWLGRADLVYRAWQVIVEYDGDQHRTDTRQFDKDVQRLERFAAHGWTVVRITGRAFFGDRSACLLRVEHALVSAGWSRP